MKNTLRNTLPKFFLIGLLSLLPAACSKKSPDISAPAPKAETKTFDNSGAGNAVSQANRDAQVVPNDQKTPLDTSKAADSELSKRSTDDLLLDMGLGLHNQGRDDEAREAFEDAFLNSGNAKAVSNLGNYEFLDGNYAKAKEYYQLAVDTDPDFAEGWYNLGNAVYALGKGKSETGKTTLSEAAASEAESYYRKSLELKPDFKMAQENLVRLLLQMDRPEEAAVYLKAAKESAQKASAQKPSQ